jgi:hypothetical protein
MPLTFQFKPVGNPKFDLKGITVALREALQREGIEQRRLLNKTTRTWEGDVPYFVSEATVSPTQLTMTTGPHGEGKGAQKWKYLEGGTRVRWAVMGKGFKPKTRRAYLNSMRGKGGAVIVGKRAMMARGIKPRPGIKARNWIAEVNKERSRKFKGLMQRVFEQIAKNTITPGALRKP